MVFDQQVKTAAPSYGRAPLGPKKRTEEIVYLKGKVKWCKHIAPDFTFDTAGKWSVVLYLEGAELEKARDLQAQGIKNTIRKDDDGWYITLSRKCSYEVRGKNVGRTPPEVFRMDGENKVAIDSRVGNGSDGIAKCVLWSSPNFPGKNLRWEALRVDTLIEYEDLKKDYPELQELAAQKPEALWE